MSHPLAITLESPLVASPNQAMKALLVSRSTLYALINSGELKSYTEGKSRRITVKSIAEYIERRLADEAKAPDRRWGGARNKLNPTPAA
jgi:excisionase family DNA binding protein